MIGGLNELILVLSGKLWFVLTERTTTMSLGEGLVKGSAHCRSKQFYFLHRNLLSIFERAPRT